MRVYIYGPGKMIRQHQNKKSPKTQPVYCCEISSIVEMTKRYYRNNEELEHVARQKKVAHS
jgi:hypothetical protein